MPRQRRPALAVVALASALAASAALESRQSTPQFGAAYSGLGTRRQALIDDWVARFNQTTGQKLMPAEFYDTALRISTKTTFDAVTHALMTTLMTDGAGAPLGDALDLVEHLDTVRGAFKDASGDHQFRIYVRLRENAIDRLSRSTEFKRGADNTVYHKGYPTNYRQQGGTPSIQMSIALDGRRADVDVDYRSSGFPAAIFNGHLTAANSDVRAGDNADRHSTRWLGFQNWWRSFFGVTLKSVEDVSVASSQLALPAKPRAGDKAIDVMVSDFLSAWLVEGNVVEAMGYVAPRASACLALDEDDPAAFDRGMAPFVLMQRMKAAYDALGPHTSLAGLTLGVRLSMPGLRVVQQPHHPQVVIYSVPDDIAATFDCQSRLTPADRPPARAYGRYHGAVFHLNVPGGRDHTMSLLWARDAGFWKLVSWRAEPEDDGTRPLHTTPDLRSGRVAADPTLVAAARGFLESWLIRKQYDTAFAYFSPSSYACYDLVRGPKDPASTSPEDAGQRIRRALEDSGRAAGQPRDLNAILVGVEPTHPAVRVMDHAYARAFSLSSLPDSLTEAAGCAARRAGAPFAPAATPTYGRGFGMTLHFRTQSGEAPVVRLLWMKEGTGWRIAAYDVEHP
jgi:hypothetical protein